MDPLFPLGIVAVFVLLKKCCWDVIEDVESFSSEEEIEEIKPQCACFICDNFVDEDKMQCIKLENSRLAIHPLVCLKHGTVEECANMINENS